MNTNCLSTEIVSHKQCKHEAKQLKIERQNLSGISKFFEENLAKKIS